VSESFLAIVNPAAGGGRCGKLAPAALERVRALGIALDPKMTTRAGEATQIAREAYARGVRNFLAVGGDGTAFEIINGIFPQSETQGRATLGFLPLGTGNSFLRDFTTRGVEHTIEALRENRRRPCDVIRLRHVTGDVYYINMLNLGFAAEAGETANRKFKSWGQLAYVFGVLARLVNLQHEAFPHRLANSMEWDRQPCLFLAFGNSKYTGGNMLITPDANPADGQIEYVRVSPVGRLRLLWMFPMIFKGTHVRHALASRAATERVEFDFGKRVNVIVDGEVMHLDCRSLEVLPSALDVIA